MIQVNSDRMYFLSGVANSESWTQIGGQWAMYLQLNTNQAVFGGNITLNTGNIQSSKFKVTQAVTNLTNQFGAGGLKHILLDIKTQREILEPRFQRRFILIKQESITRGPGRNVLQVFQPTICLYPSREMTTR